MSSGFAKKLLLILFPALIFLAIALGIFISRGKVAPNNIANQNNGNPASATNFAASADAVSSSFQGINYIIDSNSSQFAIDKKTFDSSVFDDSLKNVGLDKNSFLLTLELQNGQKVNNGFRREYTPKTIRVVLAPISDLTNMLSQNQDNSQIILLTETGDNTEKRVVYTGTEVSSDLSTLQTTIYIDPTYLQIVRDKSTFISGTIMRALAMNLGGYLSTDLNQHIDQINKDISSKGNVAFIDVQISDAAIFLNKIKQALHFSLVSDVLAGTCSGSVTCGTWEMQPGNCVLSGSSCLRDSDCDTVPGDSCAGVSNQCKTSGSGSCFCSGADCNIGGGTNYICLHTCTCLVSGSCTRNDGTPSGGGGGSTCNNNGICEGSLGENSSNCGDCIYCGDGSCNGGETNSTCPQDCPVGSTPGPTAPPASCSGACFTGISNCGDVGRVDASGSCSGGGLCCQLPSGGGNGAVWGCQLTNTTLRSSDGVRQPPYFNVGDQVFACTGVKPLDGDDDNHIGVITKMRAVSQNTAVVDYNGTRLPSSGFTYLNEYHSQGGIDFRNSIGIKCAGPRGTALIPGIAPIKISIFGQPCNICPPPRLECSGTRNAYVNAGTMTLSPDPVEVTVGGTKTLTADMAPFGAVAINQVTFTSANTAIATASSPGVGPNPYTSTITGVRANRSTRITVIADTTIGPIGGSVAVNVSANTGPTCTISVNPNPIVGSTELISVTPTDAEGDLVTQVEFRVDGTPLPPPDDVDTAGPPWTANWTPSTLGPHTIEARATDDLGAVGPWASVVVNATQPAAWFQIGTGSVIANSSITSPIPNTCIPPACNPYLILDDPISGYPGLAVFGNTGDFSADPTNTGNVSSTDWVANTTVMPGSYSYSYFYKLADGKPFYDAAAAAKCGLTFDNTVRTGTLGDALNCPEAGADSDGYVWLRYTGPVTTGVPLNINNKRAVIFVDGDLTISGRVFVQNPADDFVFFVVSGNINVDKDVVGTAATNNVAVSGVYCADGSFNTESDGDDPQFIFRGSIAAIGGINLNRDVTTSNLDTPAELFEYAPEFLINFPSSLADKHLIWREVAP